MRKSTNPKLKKWFGDLPVKEAKASIIIQPTEIDIAGAVPNDPQCCVFAKACTRTYGSSAMLIFKRYSYIDMLSPKGLRVVYRFENPKNVQKMIERFDAGEIVQEGGFQLRAPARSRTLKARTEYKRSSKARVVGSKVKQFTKSKPAQGRYSDYIRAQAAA